MKYSNFKIQNFRLIFCILHFAFCLTTISAQSTNQSFPTPITSNEITGTIKARDIGDARLTSYFYVFNGNQGDIFINVVTKNLDGDIDIFTADNLKPLTKIAVYSDNPDSETGRVIYLRQPQKLILRIEGKTPTDQPATFRIKFAGSFEAIQGVAENETPETPTVKNNEQGEVRVNSVGTIIEVKPKPTPKTKETTAKVEKEDQKKNDEKKEIEKVETTEKKVEKNAETEKKEEQVEKKEEKKFEVVVTDNLPKTDKTQNDAENKTDEKNVSENEKTKNEKTSNKQVKPRKPKTTTTAKTVNKPKTTTEKKETKPKITPEKSETTVEPSQLENIQLIILFKDGTKIERPMSEILKVSVDKGILTVISMDGKVGRYSILDVVKMTIE